MTSLTDLFKNPTASELGFAELYAKMPFSGQRERNFEAFAQTGLPTRRVESWKYSDLRNAMLDLPKGGNNALPTSPLNKVDGALTLTFSASGVELPKAAVKGLSIKTRQDPLALSGAEEAPVAALGAALSANPHLIVIEATEPVANPVHLVFENSASLNFSRVVVQARAGAELTVLESHLAGEGFSSSVVEYSVEKTASVTRILYQDAKADAVQVFTGLVQLESEARFHQYGLGFGARLCRNETRVFLQGEGADIRVNSAYLLKGGKHYDQTSLVRHSAPSCVTRQLCKGAVLDGGEAVFQGKFYVARKAQQTDAEMAHNALILENGGSVDAKPELEIYADDVECAHGNTVGALDDDALFYMRQRGISEVAARALLTQAFILETFEGLDEQVSALLSESANDWLGHQL